MNADRFGKVAVLMGGLSAEREVSLNSGRAVLEALRRKHVDAHGIDADHEVLNTLATGGFDRVFIALHGRGGEDGAIQGALEVLGLPYTGSGVLASALGMDKLRSKRLWAGAGIMVPEYIELRRDRDLQDVARWLGFPVFVKPVREGSSLGMSKVYELAGLERAWREAARYDRRVLVERCIDGPEYTVAFLGDEPLPLIKVETPQEFYDYQAKYQLDTTSYICPCGLDRESERRLQEIAARAYELVGCHGWGRVDFMVDRQGTPYVLEINTIPGLTDHSLVPMAAKHAGIGFDEMTYRILESSDVER
jgi:D-alanine-D-alanine ligase